MISDKSCTIQVLGCLMKRPLLLGQVDKYSFNLTDFSGRLEKYVFMAVNNLFENGASTITPLDVMNTLEVDSAASATFSNQNGLEYLQDALDFSNLETFDYYYAKLKKLNLLRDLKKQGINIEEFYCEDLTNPKATEINRRFEELTNQDIIEQIKKKLLKLEASYAKNEEVQTWRAADEIEELIGNFGSLEEIGLPIQGEIFSQVINGAEKGALTIRSAPSGSYKTRMGVADACYLAYPFRFNNSSQNWEEEGNSKKILFIITEQKKEQLLKMILAYISGINESKFKVGNFSTREQERLEKAIAIMKRYQDNFLIIRMPNPTIGLVKSLIREQCLLHDIDYVFFDYIFINPGLINEFRGYSLRNDELLLMLTTALKDLAIELNVAIFTATQVNANADNSKDIRNESSIAGSRSIINKADNGCIMSRPTKEELDLIKPLTTIETPNIVTDVYKVRSGQWSQVRVWSYFDGGTMRKRDLFITDAQLNAIDDFFVEPQIKVFDWEEEESNSKQFFEALNKEGMNELNGLSSDSK